MLHSVPHTPPPRLVSLQNFSPSRLPPPRPPRPFLPSTLQRPRPARHTSGGVDGDCYSGSAPLLPPTQHLGSPGLPPPPSIRCVSVRQGRRGARAGDPRGGLTCGAPASRRTAAAAAAAGAGAGEGGLPLRARQCGLPGLAPRRGAAGEPRAGRQRWGWLRAETAATRLRNPSGPELGALLPPGLVRHCTTRGRGRGPGSPPTAAARAARAGVVEPTRGSPEPGPQAALPAVARPLCAPGIAGQN